MKNFFSSIGVLGCVLFIVMIMLLCACFGFLMLIASGEQVIPTDDGISESVETEGTSKDKIALIDLEGVIMNVDDGIYQKTLTEYLLDSLDKANEDADVKAVILRVNSPGGSGYDSSRIAEKIDQLQENGKLVVSYVEDMAASGAFWIIATTDRIFIQPESWTGSIGVYIQTIKYDDLLSKIGVKEIYVTNTNGVNKIDNKLDDPESEQYKIFKALLDEDYELFMDVIAKGRNMTRAEILPYADGRVLSGKQSVELGFTDEIGGYDQALNYVNTELSLVDPKVVHYNRLEIFGFDSFSSKVKILFKQTQRDYNSGAKVYALPEFMISE